MLGISSSCHGNDTANASEDHRCGQDRSMRDFKVWCGGGARVVRLCPALQSRPQANLIASPHYAPVTYCFRLRWCQLLDITFACREPVYICRATKIAGDVEIRAIVICWSYRTYLDCDTVPIFQRYSLQWQSRRHTKKAHRIVTGPIPTRSRIQRTAPRLAGVSAKKSAHLERST